MDDIFEAISERDLESLRRSISNGANVNESGRHLWKPLHLAVIQDNFEAVKELLGHKDIDVNSKACNNKTPLHFATKETNNKISQLLIEKGANLYAIDKEGETAAKKDFIKKIIQDNLHHHLSGKRIKEYIDSNIKPEINGVLGVLFNHQYGIKSPKKNKNIKVKF